MCHSVRPAAPTPLRDLDPRLPPVHHCGARLGGDRIDVCHRVAVHPRLVIRPYFHLHDVPLGVQFPPNYAVQEHVLGVVDHGKEALDAIGGSDDVAVPVEFGPDGESRLGQRAVVAGKELTTGPEEAAVAREGAEGGGRRGHRIIDKINNGGCWWVAQSRDSCLLPKRPGSESAIVAFSRRDQCINDRKTTMCVF